MNANFNETEIKKEYNDLLDTYRRNEVRDNFARYAGFDPHGPLFTEANKKAVDAFKARTGKNPLVLYCNKKFIETCYALFMKNSPAAVEREKAWEWLFDSLESCKFEVAVG